MGPATRTGNDGGAPFGVARHRGAARGYALIAALILLVIASLATLVAVERAQLDARREREAELLFIGDQYRNAIRSYHDHVVPGGTPQYPKTLEDLLQDQRFPVTMRHLRRLYTDPMTGKADWDLVMAGDRIVGLHSHSERATLRHAGFALADAGFAAAGSYQDWVFSAAAAALVAASGVPGVDPPPAPPSWIPTGVVGPGPGTDTGTQPQPPPAPNQPAKSQCYAEFMAPKDQCSQIPPPMGTDARSCTIAYNQLYSQCIAAVPGS